jgi:histidyl-tRNA synthetase
VTFESLRGFRDYVPPEAGARRVVEGRMRQAAVSAGFRELETPAVESLELFQVKSGEEIGRELWSFTDKGGRAVTLVAETTPSLARVFVERAKAEPLPAKWFSLSKVWRYEEPQSGRTREFSQFNVDIVGAAGPAAEVELLLTAARLLDEAGAEGLYELHVNDRELAEGLGRSLGAPDLGAYFRALNRAWLGSRSELEAALAEAGLSRDGIERLLADLATIGDGVPATEAPALLDGWLARGLPDPGPAGAARLKALFELVAATPIRDRVRLNLRVVRGLAYYTSMVFEGVDRAGKLRAILGGGRYDHLIELFGGAPAPACGFAIGDQTLEQLLRTNGRWPNGEPPLDVYVVTVTPSETPIAFELVARLRADGLAADLDLMGRPLGRQLKEAARRGAKRALIVGPRELARGMVVERDLTTGAQREVPRSAPGGRAAPPAPA